MSAPRYGIGTAALAGGWLGTIIERWRSDDGWCYNVAVGQTICTVMESLLAPLPSSGARPES